jgi:hypothetical protein
MSEPDADRSFGMDMPGDSEFKFPHICVDFHATAGLIAIEGGEGKIGRTGEPLLIQITHKTIMAGKHFLECLVDDPSLKHRVEEQIGRDITESDQLRIIEFKLTSQWAIEQAGSDASPAGVDKRLGRPGPL